MAAESSVYMSGDSLEEIYEMLEGGFLNDDVDFNKQLDAVTSTEEIYDKKKVVWERVCLFQRIKETHNSETCPGRSYTKRTKKKMLIARDEFMNIVKKRADSCNEDLCLPEDTRKMFSSFDFTPDDAVELWVVLKPVVEKFHGNAVNYYSIFYGLLRENLLTKTFGGDITLTNILLPEVGNHILMHFSTTKILL